MKRLLLFILSLIYLVATTGTSMNMHFCMGKLADLTIWGKSNSSTCSKCGMENDEKSNGCCNDEHKWVKIEDDQKTSIASIELTIVSEVEPIHTFSFDDHLFFTENDDLLPKSHAPPQSGDLAIYKRNCVFLI